MLADEFVLYTKTRNAHWNVEGPDFHSAHKFFESQYEVLDEAMDDVAERIRSIGHYAPATLKDFLKLTKLSEQSRKSNDSAGFIKELLADHEAIIIRNVTLKIYPGMAHTIIEDELRTVKELFFNSNKK